MPQFGAFATGRLVMLALILLLAASRPGSAAEPRPTVLVMGDSLSAAHNIPAESGWVALLGQRLAPLGWNVVNASISGETTAGGASRIQHALDQHHPRVVMIELGANDGLRGLPLDLAKTNLARMIEASEAVRAKVILIGMEIPPNYGPAYTGQFRSMYRELAQRYSSALLPFLLEPLIHDADAFQADRLHPVADAQPTLLDHVWPLVSAAIGKAP